MRTARNALAALAALLIGYTGHAGEVNFSPAILSNATVNVSYAATVKVSVPSGATIIDIFSNSSMPTGLNFMYDSSKGEFYITGTPRVAGSCDLDIGVLILNNGSSSMSSGVISLTVNASGGGSGGGGKVEFNVKSPATGTVSVTLGNSQLFEVEPTADPKECTIGWYLENKSSGGFYNLGSALYCEFKSSDYGVGTYELSFSGQDKSGNKSEYNWTIIVTDAGGGGSGGGDKVEFTVKNPPTGTVELTLGQEQYFEVEASGDPKDYEISWVCLKEKMTPISLGSNLSCTFKTTDFGIGEHQMIFNAKGPKGDEIPFNWTIVVASGSVKPVGEIKAASPDLYYCSEPALSKGTLLELADKASQTFSITVDANVSPLYYHWTVNGVVPSGASQSSSTYVYTHSASSSQKQIYCQVYGDDKMEELLCYAVWIIKETEEPLEIETDPAVTDGMVEIPYGPIQFSLKNGLGVEWDAIPTLSLVREDSTFAEAAAETAPGGEGVTKLTPQMDETQVMLGYAYPMLGRTYEDVLISQYYGAVRLYNTNQVNINGLCGEWAFQNEGDGVYVCSASDHTTIRWKGQRVTYVMSGGGGGGGGGGTGEEATYHNAEMAITLYKSGEARVSFGTCEEGFSLSGPYFNATGSPTTLTISYTNSGSEMASGAQDVFFKSTLPPGLTFDVTPSSPDYGKLSGTPTMTGTYSFTISGKNGTTPASTNLTITIAENNVPKPAFKSYAPNNGYGPAFVSIEVGSTTNYTVEVENTTSIDWYLDGEKVATGETFAFTPWQALAQSSHSIVCKISNTTYVDYDSKTWTCLVNGTPLVLDLEDGATIPVSAKQFVNFNYKLLATGGYGPTITWEYVGETPMPNGLGLASDGTLSGATTAAAGTHELKLRATSGGVVLPVTYYLVIEEGDNKEPVLVTSEPAADGVIAHVGEEKTYSVTCTDEDNDPLTYIWKTQQYNGYTTLPETSNTLKFTPANILPKALLCYACDGVHEPVLVRTWDLTVKSQPLAFESSTIPDVATGSWIGGSESGYRLSLTDHDTEIASVSVVSGALPGGATVRGDATRYVYIVGAPRIHGDCSFSIKVDLADGDTATLPLTMKVTGEDMANATWYIDPCNGSAGNTGLSQDDAFKSIYSVSGLLLAGDTVVFLPGDHPYPFIPVDDVSYVALGGLVRFAQGSGDTSVIDCQAGGGLAFVVGGTPWYYDYPIDVVQVPVGAKPGDYAVQTTTSDYVMHGGPYVEDGWLKVKPLWYYDGHGRIIMTFKDGGAKEYTFENFTISNAAMFYNEGGENATVRFAGDCQCSWKFCTFLWATNGVDLVLDDNATLWCHEQEKIEGFDTMTFGRSSKLKIDNLPSEITVREGVQPVFVGTPGAHTIELTRALDWGGKRAIIWDYVGQSLDEFSLAVASGEQRSNYQLQDFAGHLYVVKRYMSGGFPDLDALCPPAQILSQSPAAAGASLKYPLDLTVGTPATFRVESEYSATSGFVWLCGVRWELDGEPVDGDFYDGCTIVPATGMVDRDVVHHLKATLYDYYHSNADEAHWYFTVSPTPPTVAPLPRISATEGQEFARDFAEYVTGGYGALHFMFASGKIIDGISLTTDGVLTGTMTAALDDEDLAVSVMDEWGSAVAFTQKLHLKTSENEPPYVVSATPDEGAIDYYIGDWITFTALTEDDDTNYYYYRWVLDGDSVKSGHLSNLDTKQTYYDFSDANPAHETDESTLLLQLRDYNDGNTPWVTVKGWSITKLERPTAAESRDLGSIPVGTQNISIHLDCTTEEGAQIVDAEIVQGELPDGMELDPSQYGVYLIGEARKLGTSMFSIMYTSSNGKTATANYQITVAGEADTEPRTWCVSSYAWWDVHKNAHLGEVHRVTFDKDGGSSGLVGLAAGDTVNVYGDADLDPIADSKNRLARMDVTFNFVSGPIKLERVPAQPLELQYVNISSTVTGLDITLPVDYLPFGETYGETVQLAKLRYDTYYGVLSNKVTVTSGYFFEGAPYFDSQRVLTVKILGHEKSNTNSDVIYFADDAERRDAVMEDRYRSTRALLLAQAGVLPASLTLKGNIVYSYISPSYTAGYSSTGIRIVLDKTLNLRLGEEDYPFNMPCPVEIERGARIYVSNAMMNRVAIGNPVVIYSSDSVVFSGDEGKATIVLPSALPEHSRLAVINRYFDDRDPSEVMAFELPGTVDASQYRFVVDDELKTVYLQNYEEGEAVEEHGETTWVGPDHLGEVALGSKFTYTFDDDTKPSTYKAEGYYPSVSWFTMVGQPYATSVGEGCSFDENVGERELDLVPFISAYSSVPANLVEIGFAFPLEDRYSLYVRVEPNGKIIFPNTDSGNSTFRTLNILEDNQYSVLTKLVESYKHVYIARGEGTFTVRWGLFAMATLHADGRIVVAYGPLADAGRQAGEALCPTTYIVSGDTSRNVEFTYRSGLYAGKNDLVLKPTAYVGAATVNSTYGRIEHTAKRPGTYSTKILYHAANSTTKDECSWTRTFTWTVTGDEPAMPSITSFTSTIEPSEDGIIHIPEGAAMPTFTATSGQSATISMRTTSNGSKSESKVTSLVFTPNSPSSIRISYSDGGYNRGLYSIALTVKVGDYSAYRQYPLVNNQTFHVDASTDLAASKQYGTAEAPFKDFPFPMPSSYYQDMRKTRFVEGDSIVVHPGTYRNPIDLDMSVGTIVITNAPGGSAANTELVPEVNVDSYYYNRYGRRAITDSEYDLVLLTNGWQYVRVPAKRAVVCGLAIRESEIWGDYDRVASLQGVAGGGAFGGTYVNCVFEDCIATNSDTWAGENTDTSYGGAAHGAKLVNCLIVGCHADIGGAASNCELVNCTVADNTASFAAAGLDGQCTAKNCILRYNFCNDEPSDYESTYRINRLVPDVPTIVDCFIEGDPLFCSDYSLFNGSPCIGAGNTAHYPFGLPCAEFDIAGNVRFTGPTTISLGAFEGVGSSKVTLDVDVVGVGSVTPGTCEVVVGDSQTFTAVASEGRPVKGWYTNDVLAASSGDTFTWNNIPASCRLKVVFGAMTITVGPGGTYDYTTIADAIAAAGAGDTITVAAGTYGPVDLTGFDGAIEIRAESYGLLDPESWGAAGDVIIDGGGVASCVKARIGDASQVFRGLVLTNGYTDVSEDYVFDGAKWVYGDFKGGGGIRGGAADRCTITQCRAYQYGGGSYKTVLTRCVLQGNEVFRTGNKDPAYGGGAYGGVLEECQITGNSIPSWLIYGGGTYDAVVKNSFVWGNTSQNGRTSNAWDGDDGASVYVVEKVPTEQRVAAQPTKLLEPGEETPVFSSESQALAAAATTAVDVPSEIVANHIDAKEYVERFEIRTVPSDDGEGYVNTVELKPAEVAKVVDQIADILTTDDSGNSATDFNVQSMEKTLTNTTPGLYYALEFSSDLMTGSFKGDRHLATGSGSVILSAQSLDTPSGFWRVNVYKTPDGE